MQQEDQRVDTEFRAYYQDRCADRTTTNGSYPAGQLGLSFGQLEHIQGVRYGWVLANSSPGCSITNGRGALGQ